MCRRPKGAAPLTNVERQAEWRERRRASGDKAVMMYLTKGVSLAGLDESGRLCGMERKEFLRYIGGLAKTLYEWEWEFYADIAAYARMQISRWHSYKGSRRGTRRRRV